MDGTPPDAPPELPDHWTMKRSDFALVCQAERERWNVPAALKTAVAYRLLESLARPGLSVRTQERIGKLIDRFDQTAIAHAKVELLRLKLERPPEPDQARDVWAEIAAELASVRPALEAPDPRRAEGPTSGLPAPDPGP